MSTPPLNVLSYVIHLCLNCDSQGPKSEDYLLDPRRKTTGIPCHAHGFFFAPKHKDINKWAATSSC